MSSRAVEVQVLAKFYGTQSDIDSNQERENESRSR